MPSLDGLTVVQKLLAFYVLEIPCTNQIEVMQRLAVTLDELDMIDY